MAEKQERFDSMIALQKLGIPRADLQELCQASSRLSTLHALVQSFGQMVRKREGHREELQTDAQVSQAPRHRLTAFVHPLLIWRHRTG